MLLSLACFVVIAAGMRVASAIVVPLLLALFIAIITAPVLYWLRRKGVPKVVALLVVILTVSLMAFALVALLGTSISAITADLPEYRERLNGQLAGLEAWLVDQGVQLEGIGRDEIFDSSEFVGLLSSLLSGLAAGLSNAFLVLLVVIFILLEASSFPRKLQAISGSDNEAFSGFERVIAEIRNYMAVKTGISLVTGLLIYFWLLILGVDFAVLWGILAFFFNFVPNIGSIIAAVPALIMAFIQFGIGVAAIAAAGYAVVNVGIGNVIEPRLVGRRLGLSTLVVFLSLLFWGWLLGSVGMILSVPLTMALKIALEMLPETRWIAVLLGSESEVPEPAP